MEFEEKHDRTTSRGARNRGLDNGDIALDKGSLAEGFARRIGSDDMMNSPVRIDKESWADPRKSLKQSIVAESDYESAFFAWKKAKEQDNRKDSNLSIRHGSIVEEKYISEPDIGGNFGNGKLEAKHKFENSAWVTPELFEKPTLNAVLEEKYDKILKSTVSDRIDYLAKPKSEFWRQMDAARSEKEDRQFRDTCTFAPDISLGQSIANTEGKLNNIESAWVEKIKQAYRRHVPVGDRLHLSADYRWESRGRKKQELEDAAVKGQPFKPSINPTSTRIARKTQQEPIYNRIAHLQREKSERLIQKKMEVELGDPNLTFKPTIDQNSCRIAEQAAMKDSSSGSGRSNVVTRLSSDALQTNERRQARIEAERERQEQEHRSQAAILSSESSRILSQNPDFQENGDFLSRQNVMERRRKLNLERIRSEVYDVSGVETFQPDLRSSGGLDPNIILVKKRPERLSETTEERFDRLYRKEAQHKQKMQERIREQFYSQFDFVPRINKVSAEIMHQAYDDKEKVYEELYRNERGKQIREVGMTSAEEKSLKHCTFRPRTTKRDGAKASVLIRATREHVPTSEISREIERKEKEKQHRLLKHQSELQREEMKECTFTPAINSRSAPRPSSGPIKVRGMDQYMKMRMLAKRLKEEEQKRFAKAFLDDVSQIRLKPYTQPKPFKLSSKRRTKTPD